MEINGCVIRAGGGKVARFTYPDDMMVVPWYRGMRKKDGPWTVEQLKIFLLSLSPQPARRFSSCNLFTHREIPTPIPQKRVRSIST